MYAILDVETTGGNAVHDKITEIAIYLHDGTNIVEEYSTLVNPECFIPPFISRLTGISNEMVEKAPKFYEVAKEIIRLTDGATLVAHNANFDYGFIREEFRSLGYTFSRDYLCTVKLSRKLIPGFRSYSLGVLCSNLGFEVQNRHRAAGDARATVRLFELLLQKDSGGNVLQQFTKNDYLHLRFPPHFDHSIIDKLPEEPGVYYFHNEDGSVIYIGKSNSIRKRVLTHFANKGSRKAVEMRNSIYDISFEKTGNELVALLLESDEIKKQLPVYNRAQRRSSFNFGIFQQENKDGYLTLKAVKLNERMIPVATAHSLDEAREILETKIMKYGLCQKFCGLYDVKYACFLHSTGQCKGACVGKESPEDYNARVQKAVASLQYPHQNFMVIGKGREEGEQSVIMIENGKYTGFGYFFNEFVDGDMETIRSVIKHRQDNRDTHKIIRHYLLRNRTERIIPLEK